MATVSDVAKLAGVSPGTVSRVLSQDATLRVRESTRQSVLDAARKLDYTPNHAAKSLRKSRAGIIGIAVHGTGNPVYSAILEGAQRAAMDAGFMLVLADVDALANDEATFRRVIASGAMDGLLLQRAGTSSDLFVGRVASAKVPLVLLNEATPDDLSSVAPDDIGAGRLATEHLLDLGHTSIGLLRTSGDHSRSRDRAQGWADALESRAANADYNAVREGGQSIGSGYRAMLDLLDAGPRVTAVVAANVLAGVGALRACTDRGVRVPKGMSVVAIHDTDLAEATNPRLTVVALPLVEMGRVAVRLLEEQLEGLPTRQVVVRDPAPRLVIRESTAPPDG